MPHTPRRFGLRRADLVVRMRRRIERDSFPRLQMMGLVGLTGLSGWWASLGLLALGVDAMALRYPLALGLAYLVFLALLWLWLRTRDDPTVDIPDLSGLVPSRTADAGSAACPQGFDAGGGGSFAGGGAQASFADTGSTVSPLKDLGEVAGAATDADEVVIPLVVIAFVIGLALSSLYVVWMAPALFAELMVDGALSVALYRRLRHEDRSHWLSTAVRKTIVPLLVTGVFLAGMGAVMSASAPHARTLGDVIRHHQTGGDGPQ